MKFYIRQVSPGKFICVGMCWECVIYITIVSADLGAEDPAAFHVSLIGLCIIV